MCVVIFGSGEMPCSRRRAIKVRRRLRAMQYRYDDAIDWRGAGFAGAGLW